MAFTAARLNAAIDAALLTATHVQVHTGAPGGAGTSNVAPNTTRAALVGVGSATGQADVITAAVTVSGASGPITAFTLWTASTSGTFLGDGTLDTSETFVGAGTLNLTLTVSAT